MATYTQLQADVNEVATRTVSALAYTSLTAELNARLRLTLMETGGAINTVSGTSAYDLPSGTLELRYLNAGLSGLTTPVTLTTEVSLTASLKTSGRPVEAVVIDGKIILNPVPDDVYAIGYRGIGRLADLSGGSDTNDVMDNHYNIYLYGALKHHTAITRDIEMTAHWGGMFEEAIKQAELADARKLYGAESLAILPPQRGG